MAEVTLDSLSARLARLERENRWLKILGVVLLGAIAAVLVMGQAPQPRIIEAEGLKIHNRSGQTVVTLGADIHDWPFIEMADNKGNLAISMFSAPDSSNQIIVYGHPGPSPDLSSAPVQRSYVAMKGGPSGPTSFITVGPEGNVVWASPD